MPEFRALYSVIQFVPDSSRGEAANLGVALYDSRSGAVSLRVSKTLQRVKKFFSPKADELRRIGRLIESLQHRLNAIGGEHFNESEFARFISARADAVRLTAPRLIMVSDPGQDLSNLYDELIGEYEPTAFVATQSHTVKLPETVYDVFAELEQSGLVWRPKRIKVPMTGTSLEVEAAYQNGVTNYVRTESLSNKRRLDQRLSNLGFNGQLIYQHEVENKKSRLIVLSADPNVDSETERRFEDTLSEFHVRFVPYHAADEFAQEVEKTAHL